MATETREITQSLLVEAIITAFPYASQITKLDLGTEADAVWFTWRSHSFRCSVTYLGVEEVKGSMLAGSDIAILAEVLIKRAITDKLGRVSR